MSPCIWSLLQPLANSENHSKIVRLWFSKEGQTRTSYAGPSPIFFCLTSSSPQNKSILLPEYPIVSFKLRLQLKKRERKDFENMQAILLLFTNPLKLPLAGKHFYLKKWGERNITKTIWSSEIENGRPELSYCKGWGRPKGGQVTKTRQGEHEIRNCLALKVSNQSFAGRSMKELRAKGAELEPGE